MTRPDYLAAVRAWAAENLPRGAMLPASLRTAVISLYNHGEPGRVHRTTFDDLISRRLATPDGRLTEYGARAAEEVLGLYRTSWDIHEFAARLEAVAADLRPREFEDERTASQGREEQLT